MASVAPGLGAGWPTYRDLDGTLGGVGERRGNVSDVWAWLGGYELARGYAADLFDDTQVAAVPTLLEHTADALSYGVFFYYGRMTFALPPVSHPSWRPLTAGLRNKVF